MTAPHAPQTPQPDLESLMASYAAGQQRAFDELYRTLAPRLFASLIPLTRDHAKTEDLIQTTFLKLHRARHRYVAGSPVFPWAYVIAKRTWYDERRPLAARWELLSQDGALPQATEPDTHLEETMGLQHALQLLPPSYRHAIELTKLSGMTGTEAARQLQTSTAAIKQRVHRGYALLRSLLHTAPQSGAATESHRPASPLAVAHSAAP